MSDTAGTDNDEVVTLHTPADTRHAATARVVAASLAADLGFDVDEIDDLRLAVNEAVALMLDGPAGGPTDATLGVRFSVGADRIAIEVSRSDGADGLAFDDLADRILAAVVDRHEIVGGAICLSKSARDRDGG